MCTVDGGVGMSSGGCGNTIGVGIGSDGGDGMSSGGGGNTMGVGIGLVLGGVWLKMVVWRRSSWVGCTGWFVVGCWVGRVAGVGRVADSSMTGPEVGVVG